MFLLQTLRSELKEREHLVVSTLDQARMFLADQPIEGPGEPRKNLQPKTGRFTQSLCENIIKALFWNATKTDTAVPLTVHINHLRCISSQTGAQFKSGLAEQYVFQYQVKGKCAQQD